MVVLCGIILSRVGLYSYQMMFIIKQIITTSILLSLPAQFVVGKIIISFIFPQHTTH